MQTPSQTSWSTYWLGLAILPFSYLPHGESCGSGSTSRGSSHQAMTGRLLERGYPYTRMAAEAAAIRWIHSLAKIDGRLLELLRLAKDREWVYGQIPNTAAAQNIGPSLCTTMGWRGDAGMPDKVRTLSCPATSCRMSKPPASDFCLSVRSRSRALGG